MAPRFRSSGRQSSPASTSPDIEWVEDTLKRLEAEGRSYDCFSILRPTSPFRTAGDHRARLERLLAEQGVDSLRAVEKVAQHPGKMWVVRGKRMMPLLPLGPERSPGIQSQMAALPEVYVQNASLEIAWTRVVFDGRTIAGVNVMPFFTERPKASTSTTSTIGTTLNHLLRKAIRLPEVSERPSSKPSNGGCVLGELIGKVVESSSIMCRRASSSACAA